MCIHKRLETPSVSPLVLRSTAKPARQLVMNGTNWRISESEYGSGRRHHHASRTSALHGPGCDRRIRKRPDPRSRHGRARSCPTAWHQERAARSSPSREFGGCRRGPTPFVRGALTSRGRTAVWGASTVRPTRTRERVIRSQRAPLRSAERGANGNTPKGQQPTTYTSNYGRRSAITTTKR